MVTEGAPLWRVTPALASVSTPTSGHSARIASRRLLNSLRKFLREVGALEDPRLRGKALTANKSGLWRGMVSYKLKLG